MPQSDVHRLAEPAGTRAGPAELAAQRAAPDLAEQDRTTPDPIVYQIKVQVDTHAFTTSQVLPIDADGKPDGLVRRSGHDASPRARSGRCPPSTIYGFNGTFPGPMINAEYGKPALVRFENQPGREPARTWTARTSGPRTARFLTHLHNGHTAPESDGNPHYSMLYGPAAPRAIEPGDVGRQPVPELAGGWRRPRRSRASSGSTTTGWITPARTSTRAWSACTRSTTPRTAWTWATRRRGLRLPGVRTDNGGRVLRRQVRHPAGVLRLSRLDDGVTTHQDMHDGMGEYPEAGQPAHAPRVVGQDVLQALPQPRLRR